MSSKKPSQKNKILRIAGRKQGDAALSETEEYYRLFQGILRSTSDGILAVNRENEVLFANERFVEMWLIPQEIMVGKDDVLLQHVLDQLTDPQGFLQKVQELYLSTEESFDTLYFKDGRVFERLSRPLMQEAELRGRVWSFRDITAHKRAEEALRESEERHRLLFDRMMDGVYRSTHEGRFVDANPAMVKMFGYSSKQEMLEVDIKSELYFAPEERGSHVLDTGREEMDVYRMRRKDGSEIWVEDHGSYIHDEHGRIIYHEGMLRDITGRKQAEAELFKLRKAVEASGEVIFLTDRDGLITFVNPEFVRLYSYSAEEVVGRATPRILKSGRMKPEDYALFWKTILGKQIVRAEIVNQTKDGRLLTIEGSVNPILDDDGNIAGFLAIQRDITERKQMEEALAVSEAELRTLFASMHDVALVIDREGVYRKIAPTNPGLLVKPPEELLGKNLRDVFPAEKAESFCETMQQVLDSHQNKQIEYELMIADRNMWFQTTISPLDADSTLWVAHDITNRKQAEEALWQAEVKYHNIFENATEGIFQTVPSGKFITANPALARMLGYNSPEELIADVDDVNHEFYEQPGRRAEFVRQLEEHGTLSNFESQVYRKDGRAIWISENARAVRDDAGQALHYEGTLIDITERKRAETERQVLLEIMQGIASTKSLQEFLELIRQSINKVMPAENCSVVLYNKETELFEEVYAIDKYDPPMAPSKLEKSITAYVFRTSESLLLDQERFDELAARGEVELVGTDSACWLGAPLRTPSETFGVIAIQDYEKPNCYSERDREFLTFIGAQVALAIERKYAEEELRRAKEALEIAHNDLQQSFLREQHLARTDLLTGVNNRGSLFELIQREFEVAMRYRPPLTVLMFDIDDFKHINDTYGHAVGDQVLKKITQIILPKLRSADVIGRYGGDEFIILLPQTSAQDAQPLAQRIHAGIAFLRIETAKGSLSVTISLGITQTIHHTTPVSSWTSHPDTVEDLLLRADQALYAAKQAGKNCSMIFNPNKVEAG